MKYRVWDESIKFLDDSVRTTSVNNTIMNVEVLDGFSDWRELEEDKHVLMSSTNIYDIDKNEIYEGDILELKIDGKTYNGNVIYDDGKFMIQSNHSKIPLSFYINSLKINGNIYKLNYEV